MQPAFVYFFWSAQPYSNNLAPTIVDEDMDRQVLLQDGVGELPD